MLYHLLYGLADWITPLRVFRFITMRTILAVLTAMLIAFLLGPWFIRKMQQLQIGQYIQEDGPASHRNKAGTPTMGGVLILVAVSVACLLWGDLTNAFLWLVLLTTLLFGAIGLADDWRKVVMKRNLGLTVKQKIAAQIVIAGAMGAFLVWLSGLAPGASADFWDVVLGRATVFQSPYYNTQLYVPFFKLVRPELGWFYVPFVILVVAGTSNAVNLTDGLDGLAIGPVIIAAGTYMIFAYLTGNAKAAGYLQIAYMPATGEVTVFCGALVGAGIGFLWFNSHPAQVFMGDTGSLALGAALGAVAVVTKHEILLVLVGGLFVIEALSVIFQVGYFKATNGKRIFLMAPLHHHFEHKGWAESKVTVRFWIIAVVLSLLALSTLKLR
ncbi:MAG: phospho-N-acetylmuramoyl-pentapeptide-transferase [Proteobacteria bacterium]|nr:phospho-N-acetylmuramoyl-pentapeptide-transferase [Pseudomonadota bacterium]MBU1740181.1 phospho-N-acetylmuramoyl-pentapeptide-transferase [Pseudomonadota bacterium]